MAIREQSQCRMRLVYVRTSKSPNPVSCLARSNHFSMCHRENATRIRSLIGVRAGALLTKYLISPVSVFHTMISQYLRSVGFRLDTR